ncbi:MAG: four helix bundle protein [Dehalococcoidia bacterium]
MTTRSKEQGASSKGYRRVIAFRKADLLAKRAYALSKKVAKTDGWLASQLSRAAVSAPLNIVEGHGRGTTRDFLRFLETASTSISEVEYLLEFMLDVEILTEADIAAIEPIRSEAAATLSGLIKALRNKAKQQPDWNRNGISDGHEPYYASEEHEG